MVLCGECGSIIKDFKDYWVYQDIAGDLIKFCCEECYDLNFKNAVANCFYNEDFKGLEILTGIKAESQKEFEEAYII